MHTKPKQTACIKFDWDEIVTILIDYARTEIRSESADIYDFDETFDVDDVEMEDGNVTIFVI
jgi:hypothetical protein